MFSLRVPSKFKSEEIKEFKSDAYYSKMDACREEKSGHRLQTVLLNSLGTELVAQYYSEKYNTDITIFDDSDKFCKFLARTRIPENKRKAFILILGDEAPHATPIIYINENKEEGLLFANSQGTSTDHAKYWASKFRMPFYYVSELRQSDRVSCYIDALVFSRDVTAIHRETGAYCLPDLLAKLKTRSKKIDENIHVVRLPDELLKSSQMPEFVEVHSERSERKIHKSETLTLFRTRYTDNGNFIISHNRRDGEIKKDNIPSYLRKKGLKLANIIEIQFYINELKGHYGSLWKPDMRERFIREAKALFAAQTSGGLYMLAQSFLSKSKKAKFRAYSAQLEA